MEFSPRAFLSQLEESRESAAPGGGASSKPKLLRLYHGQGGGEGDGEVTGAVTVANLNNTNGRYQQQQDGSYTDISDVTKNAVQYEDGRGREEVDLMKLEILQPQEAVNGTNVKLQVGSGAVAIWKHPWKGELFALDANRSGSVPVANPETSDAGDLILTLWVEATAKSAFITDIEIKATYGAQSDRVVATAIWADIERGPFYGQVGIPTLNDLTNPPDGNATLTNGDLIQLIFSWLGTGASYSGFGTWTPTGTTTTWIGGRMLVEFVVKPMPVNDVPVFRLPDRTHGLTWPKFDVTQQKDGCLWLMPAGGSLAVQDTWLYPWRDDPWLDNELPTDDAGNILDAQGRPADEQNVPRRNNQYHLYTYDVPSLTNDPTQFPVSNVAFAVYKLNLKTWVRVRFDGTDFSVGAPNVNPPQEGSRCSDKCDWWVSIYLRRGSGGVLVLDTANPSFSEPIKSRADQAAMNADGSVSITLYANAATQGYSLTYTESGSDKYWVLTPVSGTAQESQRVSSAAPGFTWNISVTNVIAVGITQGNTIFQNGDRFLFSVFKAPNGKSSGIGTGQIQIAY